MWLKTVIFPNNMEEAVRGRRMSNPRKQHIVPRSFLKNFADKRKADYYFYTLEKRTGQIHGTNIKDASVERDFYTLEASDNKYAWEEFYSLKVEPFQRSIDSIVEIGEKNCIASGATIISEKHKSDISKYMFYQLFRTREMRLFAEESLEKMLPDLMASIRARFGRSGDEEQDNWVNRFEPDGDIKKIAVANASTNFELVHKYSKYAEERCWAVFRVVNSMEFITSDNPIIILDWTKREGHFLQFSFFDPRTVVYYPISSKLLLCLFQRGTLSGVPEDCENKIIFLDSDREERFVKIINSQMLRQCTLQAYARNEKVLKNLRKIL